MMAVAVSLAVSQEKRISDDKEGSIAEQVDRWHRQVIVDGGKDG